MIYAEQVVSIFPRELSFKEFRLPGRLPPPGTTAIPYVLFTDTDEVYDVLELTGVRGVFYLPVPERARGRARARGGLMENTRQYLSLEVRYLIILIIVYYSWPAKRM